MKKYTILDCPCACHKDGKHPIEAHMPECEYHEHDNSKPESPSPSQTGEAWRNDFLMPLYSLYSFGLLSAMNREKAKKLVDENIEKILQQIQALLSSARQEERKRIKEIREWLLVLRDEVLEPLEAIKSDSDRAEKNYKSILGKIDSLLEATL